MNQQAQQANRIKYMTRHYNTNNYEALKENVNILRNFPLLVS